MITVLTADLIDSSLYEEPVLQKVISTLQEEFKVLEKAYAPEAIRFELFRGDSFQGVINQPELGLHITLQLKASINRIRLPGKRASSKIADFRAAIGIGNVDFESESIAGSNGQAFQFSGRMLDKMKSENRKTRLITPQEDINAEFNASLFLLDLLIDRWSTASAEVVYFLLMGLKEQQISDKLEISQSAVNQRKKAAGWEAISVLLERYRESTSKLFKNG